MVGMDFSQFLQKWYVEYNGPLSNDGGYEEYNEWLGELDPDEWMKLAQEWQEAEMEQVKGVVL